MFVLTNAALLCIWLRKCSTGTQDEKITFNCELKAALLSLCVREWIQSRRRTKVLHFLFPMMCWYGTEQTHTHTNKQTQNHIQTLEQKRKRVKIIKFCERRHAGEVCVFLSCVQKMTLKLCAGQRPALDTARLYSLSPLSRRALEKLNRKNREMERERMSRMEHYLIDGERERLDCVFLLKGATII